MTYTQQIEARYQQLLEDLDNGNGEVVTIRGNLVTRENGDRVSVSGLTVENMLRVEVGPYQYRISHCDAEKLFS